MAVENIAERLKQSKTGDISKSAQSQIEQLNAQLAAAQADADALDVSQYKDITTSEQRSGFPTLRFNKTTTAQQQYDSALKQKQAGITDLQSQIAKQQAIVNDPTSQLSGIDKEMIKGAEFGQTVLGEKGLGRMSENQQIMGNIDRLQQLSEKGLSSEEMSAQRAQMMQGIDGQSETARRQLQASLGAAGVKGATAGSQMMRMALQTQQQKFGVERDLFLKSADIKRESLDKALSAQGKVQSFDLGQAAKEKQLVMDSAFGFAQLGEAQRARENALKIAQQNRAAEQAAADDGSYICSEIGRHVSVTRKEIVAMRNVIKYSAFNKSLFSIWYSIFGLKVANAMKNDPNVNWNEVKEESISKCVALIEQGAIKEATELYIDFTLKYAKKYNIWSTDLVKSINFGKYFIPFMFLIPSVRERYNLFKMLGAK